MKKFLTTLAVVSMVFVPAFDADAASKKTSTRDDYSKAQQEKFFKEATALCRKHFGSSLHRVKVDYKKKKYVCYHY